MDGAAVGQPSGTRGRWASVGLSAQGDRWPFAHTFDLPCGCSLFGAARHDLPCDVPLPSGASYARPFSLPGGAPAGATGRGWVFSVAHTSWQALHDVYARQLPANGWTCVTDSLSGLPADDAVYVALQSFTAYKDGQGLAFSYRGDTGEVAILVTDFHASASPC